MRKLEVAFDESVYGKDGPQYAHEGDAGIDLRCAEDFTLEPHSVRFVWCGLSVKLPEETFGAIRSRSGLARKYGVDVIDGTIDEGYTGKIGVTMRSMAQGMCHFAKGERICQLVIVPCVHACIERVDAIAEDPRRGSAGWGSTGLA